MNTLKKNKNNKKMRSSIKVEISTLRQEVSKLLEEKKYNAAMEKIISLFNAGQVSYDLMLDLANIYYTTKDYQRAEKWTYNSLDIKKTCQGYFLLAKIYNNVNDTEHMAEALDEALGFDEMIPETDVDLCNDMELLAGLTYDDAVLSTRYPNIAKALENDDVNINNNAEEMTEADNLKNDIKDSNDRDSVMEMETAQNAADSIEQMINDELKNEEETAQEVDTQSEQDDLVNDTADDENTGNDAAIDDMRTEILQEDNSLAEKIKKLNAVAAKYYLDNDLQAAQNFLETAYTIDAYDIGTLRNLIYLSLQQKDKERAFDYAMKMPIVELELLDKIKNS